MNEIETLQNRIKELEAENELLNDALKDKSQVHAEIEANHIERINTCTATIKKLRKENAKLRYALARLRWEHAHNMETMIDQLYTERPSSWRFYYKSKVYWYNKWQELKKKLMEGK